MRRRRPSRGNRRGAGALLRTTGALLLALALPACATAPPTRRPIAEEARAALALLEQRRQAFTDLRTAAHIRIRKGGQIRDVDGALLLRTPASFLFQATSPFGLTVLAVAGDGKSLTLWEVADERAYIAPDSPDANRRWLGVSLGGEDLVPLLSGRVRPLPDPAAVELMPPDEVGPSLVLTGANGQQRIWFDPDGGGARQVEWTGGNSPARVLFAPAPADAPPAGLSIETLDGSLQVSVTYRNPRMNTGLDPALLGLSVPEHVRIQDFR